MTVPGEPRGGRAHSGPPFRFPGPVWSALRPRDRRACLTSAEAGLRVAALRAGGRGSRVGSKVGVFTGGCGAVA